MNLNNFITRAIVGALYVAIIIGSLILGSASFGILCLIILIISMMEYFKLTKRLKVKTPSDMATIAAVILFLVVFLHKEFGLAHNFLMIVPLIFIFIMIIEMFKRTRNPITNIAVTCFSFIYIFVPITSLYWMGFYNQYNWTNEFHYTFLIGFFVLVWANDTGAYLLGSTIGKHKLFEKISPKKTIEGSLGGLVLSLVVAYFIAQNVLIVKVLDWMVIAILVVLFGTVGDLFESLIKRKAEVKDSGKILPGHGGMLDRFDGILFAAPVVLVYLSLVANS